MKIRLLFIGMLLTMTQGAWANGGGDGTSELTPIVISSVTQLNQLSLNVRVADFDGYEGKYIKLEKDLDFSEVAPFDTDGDGEVDSNFWPIGYSDENENSPFRGIFNGGGHTIKGIRVNRPSADYIGLFALTEGATIKNLRIEDCTFVGNTCVGAVVGMSNVKIESSGEDRATKGGDTPEDLSENYVGPSECILSDCYVAKDVSVQAAAKAGGIFGYAYWTTASNCVSAAKVEAASQPGGVGGLMETEGSLMVKLIDCYYLGSSTLNVYGEQKGGTNFYISLLDDDSEASVFNDIRLHNYAGQHVEVKLLGRKLYLDGSWNTLCLPFDYDAFYLEEDGLDIDDIRTLQKAQFNESNGELTLEFTPKYSRTPEEWQEGAVEYIEAGVPYLVKWKNIDAVIENPTFSVDINEAAPKTITSNGVSFVGTYGTVQFPGATPNVLYLGAENKLFYPKSAMNFNAFRAYFELDETLFGADSPNNIREFHLDFGEETGIQMVLADERAAADADAWYTLDGRRLAGKPAAKGIYLKGGKTICITE